MDLFDLQAEFAKHWLGLSAEIAHNAGVSLAHSAVLLASEPQPDLLSPVDLSPVNASVASWLWSDPFQLMQVFAPNPFDLSSSWTAWPMTQLPWGQAPSFLALMPWSFGRWSFDPWSLGIGAWPVGGVGGSMGFLGQPSAWGAPSFGHAPLFLGWTPAAPTATDVLEHVAAAYRSAGGHAVAIAFAPMQTPLTSSNYGQWWPSPARYASF